MPRTSAWATPCYMGWRWICAKRCNSSADCVKGIWLESWLTKGIEAWTKWPPTCKQHFQMHFLEWYVLYFELCSIWNNIWINYKVPSLPEIPLTAKCTREIHFLCKISTALLLTRVKLSSQKGLPHQYHISLYITSLYITSPPIVLDLALHNRTRSWFM